MLDKIKVDNKEFVFETKPGVFAQYGIDYGSQLLLQVVDFPEKGNVLDIVVSNPPTHQGREVLMDFIQGAYTVLNKKGEAYFVVNRMTSVLNKMKDVFGNSEKVKRKKGYIVYKSTK